MWLGFGYWRQGGSLGPGKTHFAGHEAGPRRADISGARAAGVAHAPGCRKGMAGEEADAFFDIAESFGRLSLSAPFNFAGIDVDGPESDRGRIDSLAARKTGTPVQGLPGSHFGIAKDH